MAKDSSIASQRTPELPGLVKRGRPATGKAKTNAERQAAYRIRKSYSADDPECRLSVMVSRKVDYALERLAFHYGVTKKAALERLILGAENQILDECYQRGGVELQSYYIWQRKLDMTHPERPDQGYLDYVLACEAAEAAQVKNCDAVTEKRPKAVKRDTVTKSPGPVKTRDAVTKKPTVSKSRAAVTKKPAQLDKLFSAAEQAIRDATEAAFGQKSVTK